jgi:hypothetical protein
VAALANSARLARKNYLSDRPGLQFSTIVTKYGGLAEELGDTNFSGGWSSFSSLNPWMVQMRFYKTGKQSSSPLILHPLSRQYVKLSLISFTKSRLHAPRTEGRARMGAYFGSQKSLVILFKLVVLGHLAGSISPIEFLHSQFPIPFRNRCTYNEGPLCNE